jgi:integrase/recombinase XerD
MKKEITLFLQHLSDRKGCSSNTLAAYNNDLNQLASFVQSRIRDGKTASGWSNLDKYALAQYMLSLKQKRYAPATVARKIATAKSFMTCMVDMGRLSCNPAEDLASPRVNKHVPKTLSIAQLHVLLHAPTQEKSLEAKRDQAMLELLYATGMRVSQLVALNIADVNCEECSIVCISRPSSIRCIIIEPRVIGLVEIYINDCRPRFTRNDDPALFLNQRGERLTRQGFWLILKGYAEKTGLGSSVTPHTLRHSFAVHKLKTGTDLHSVQQMLGHAHILSTKVYQQVQQTV